MIILTLLKGNYVLERWENLCKLPHLIISRSSIEAKHISLKLCSLPKCHNYWSPRAATTEARAPRARALQQEKPPNEQPAHRNKE